MGFESHAALFFEMWNGPLCVFCNWIVVGIIGSKLYSLLGISVYPHFQKYLEFISAGKPSFSSGLKKNNFIPRWLKLLKGSPKPVKTQPLSLRISNPSEKNRQIGSFPQFSV